MFCVPARGLRRRDQLHGPDPAIGHEFRVPIHDFGDGGQRLAPRFGGRANRHYQRGLRDDTSSHLTPESSRAEKAHPPVHSMTAKMI